jgi:hypothetical protein
MKTTKTMEGQQEWPYYSLGPAFQKNAGEATPTPPYCILQEQVFLAGSRQ